MPACPLPAAVSATVLPAGQLTVPVSRSILNAFLENRPPGATGGCTLQLMSRAGLLQGVDELAGAVLRVTVDR